MAVGNSRWKGKREAGRHNLITGSNRLLPDRLATCRRSESQAAHTHPFPPAGQSFIFQKLAAYEQRTNPSPASLPKAVPGTIATFSSFSSLRQNSFDDRPNFGMRRQG